MIAPRERMSRNATAQSVPREQRRPVAKRRRLGVAPRRLASQPPPRRQPALRSRTPPSRGATRSPRISAISRAFRRRVVVLAVVEHHPGALGLLGEALDGLAPLFELVGLVEVVEAVGGARGARVPHLAVAAVEAHVAERRGRRRDRRHRRAPGDCGASTATKVRLRSARKRIVRAELRARRPSDAWRNSTKHRQRVEHRGRALDLGEVARRACSRSLAVNYGGYCSSTPPSLPASRSGVDALDEELEARARPCAPRDGARARACVSS